MWKENARPLDQLFGKQISHTIPKGLIPFKCIRSNLWKVLNKRKCVGGRGARGISNHRNPVRKFAIVPFTEPIK